MTQFVKNRELYLASHNHGKILEFQQILSPLAVSCLSLPPSSDIRWDEWGDSFAVNARIKARAVFDTLNAPVLGDDSGLCVDALQGAPGVFSARYAGPSATDHENCAKLLDALAAVPLPKRKATFVCHLIFIDERGDEFSFVGETRGHILLEKRGREGFGYDPLFVPDGQNESFAELDPAIKSHISHRAKATRLFYDFYKNRK